MNLTKSQKILIGILHFAPIIGFVLYFISFFSIFFNISEISNNSNGQEPSAEFLQNFATIFVILGITILMYLVILIFDIIHLVKSNKNDTNNKIVMWILILLFTQGIGGIIYFFLEILPEKKNNTEKI